MTERFSGYVSSK